jgi:hypothetical protein
MKTKSILFGALLSVGAVSVAVAGELYPLPVQDNAGAPKVRAEVVTQTQQALKAGEIAKGELTFVAQAPATLGRAQVAAETREAQRLGLIAHGELGEPVVTAAQLDAVRLAGEAALGNNIARTTDSTKSE